MHTAEVPALLAQKMRHLAAHISDARHYDLPVYKYSKIDVPLSVTKTRFYVSSNCAAFPVPHHSLSV